MNGGEDDKVHTAEDGKSLVLRGESLSKGRLGGTVLGRGKAGEGEREEVLELHCDGCWFC